MNINIKGNLLSFDKPVIMGILNLTPDSFYKASRISDAKSAENQISQMLENGADIIDIGAMSSRPGAEILSSKDEWMRLKPVLEIIQKRFSNSCFSIDTINSEIVKRSVQDFGISIINDISAGNLDEKMFGTIAELQVPYIMMHMRGTPSTMQQLTDYNSLTQDIIFYFSEKIRVLNQLGVNDIIIDPGFGFSKTTEQNYKLLNELDSFQIFKVPILAGLSRKSMIWKPLNITPDESLNGTTALNMFALTKGAKILRVHDVKEAKETVDLFLKLKRNG
jgi:dihydropteroate synthase